MYALPVFAAAALPAAADDQPLAHAAGRGDEAAFTALYHRYRRLVHGILLSRVPPREVEDLVQEVFLLAWRHLPRLRSHDSFPHWLASITRNRANDYHRQARAHVPLDEGQLRQSAPPPEALAVLDTIRALPEAYRETLVLRLVEGLTGPEIAAQTGLTPESVRVNLHRGMKLLRERLEGGPAR